MKDIAPCVCFACYLCTMLSTQESHTLTVVHRLLTLEARKAALDSCKVMLTGFLSGIHSLRRPTMRWGLVCLQVNQTWLQCVAT